MSDSLKEYSLRGFVFKQFWQYVPELRPFYTDFENDYDVDPVLIWMKSNSWLPIVAVVLYLIFCYYGVKLMNNFKAYDLKYTLALWNLALSIFSTWGMLRTVPHLFYNIYRKDFKYTFCDDPVLDWGAGATGLAVQLFILSKFPELIDTLFIVLRKKPLIFLHWYHHVTVLLYCWHSYVTESAAGIYFVAMNYTVHAIMYFYYFLQGIRCFPRWIPSWTVTSLQISQMFIGIVVVAGALYYHVTNEIACKNELSNLIAGTVMYSSYLLLFLKFAIDRFILKPLRKKSGNKTI